jgi:integration host factor subunit alpha
MSMTKADIVESIYEQLGMPRNHCVNIVESFFEIMKDELSNGHDVMISGFGKWSVLSKKERKGRNPQTGKEMHISARKVVSFKPSKHLRDQFI